MNHVILCYDRDLAPARFYSPNWETRVFNFARDIRNEGKWRNIRTVLAEMASGIREGDYFWFPDPDLEFEEGMPSALFSEMHLNGLDLAQPAVAPGGYCSHRHLEQQPQQEGWKTPRKVGFVEIMCPCFSLAALRRNLWTFGLNFSGFGIDCHIWPQNDQAYVLDHLVVIHRSSPGYRNTARKAGLPDPGREAEEVKRQYGRPA